MRIEAYIPKIVLPEETQIRAERQSQHLMEAFWASGIFFMLLPGTFLGVWNLIGISRHHALSARSPAWIQAHGWAKIFGWVGSLILGIGLYSLTKMQNTGEFPVRDGWTTWGLWTAGVAFRWLGTITGWKWQSILPLAGVLELAGFLLFLLVLRRHRPTHGQSASATWMVVVIFSTLAFLRTLAANAGALFLVGVSGSIPCAAASVRPRTGNHGDLERSGADHLGIQRAMASDLRRLWPATLQAVEFQR